MKSEKWKTHVILTCIDCEKSFENYFNAESKARKHAEKENHKVTGEVAFAVVYDGRW